MERETIPERDPGATLWITGPDPARCRDTARAVMAVIGRPCTLLDGESCRRLLWPEIAGGADEDIRRLGRLCGLLQESGSFNLVAARVDREELRGELRRELVEYIEAACLPRDDAGHLDPDYEPHGEPDLILPDDPGPAAGLVRQWLADMGYLAAQPAGYTPEEEEAIRKRLEDLGYL